MPRPYKAATKSELQKEIDIEVGKKLKQARAERIVMIDVFKGTENIDSYPKNKLCTQIELAKILKCTFQQIQKFEKGKSTLSLFKIFLATKFLNLKIEEFTDIYKSKLDPSFNTEPKQLDTKLVGQYEPPINSSKDRDCSLSSEL